MDKLGVVLFVLSIVFIALNFYAAVIGDRFAIFNMGVALLLTYQATRLGIMLWEDWKDSKKYNQR